MKTHETTIYRSLVAASLLLTIVAGLPACDSAEPVKPQSAYRPIPPAVVPDTLTVDPDDPEPISTQPIVKLPDPQPE